MAEDWKKAAEELDGKVAFAEVDATIHTTLGEKFEVKGYPTIKFFKHNFDAENYSGARKTSDMV